MQKFLVIALAAAACALGSSAGYATNIAVTVSETSLSGTSHVVASWIQDQDPTPEAYVDGYYTTVPVWDAVGLGTDTAVSWYSNINDQLGGFTNYNEDFNILAQTSYASGESTPVFLPGSYHGVDIKPDYTYIIASYTIAVLPDPVFKPAFSRFNAFIPNAFTPNAAVPEPATWAMMIVGIGIVGLIGRRRPKVTAAYG